MRFAAGAALVIAALTIASPSAAYGASYLDEAVQALQTQHVYVSPLAPTIDSATRAQLEQQTNGTTIGVVVLPESAKSEAGDIPHFLAEIAQGSGKDTVVVAFGSDLEAGSRALPGGTAAKLANQAEQSNATTGEALVDFVSEVQNTAPAADNGTSADPNGIVGIAIVMVVLAAMVAGGFAWFKRRQRQGRTPKEDLQAVPSKIREQLAAINSFAIEDPGMKAALEQGMKDTVALFGRIRKAEPNKIEQVTAQYAGHLKDMNSMLAIYTDVQANPRHFQPYTADYLRDGKSAAQQYADGVLKNIQEVTRGSWTNFQVDIKMLANANPPQDPTIL